MFAVSLLFAQLCPRRSPLHKEDALMARRVTTLHFESHALHWVANLPDEEYYPLLGRLKDQIPGVAKTPVGSDTAQKPELFGCVLVPIVVNNGAIPQDDAFQAMLMSMNLDARQISDMLDHHYKTMMTMRATA